MLFHNYLSDLTELDGTALPTMDGSVSRGRFALMPSTTFGNRNWYAIGGTYIHVHLAQNRYIGTSS